MKQREISVKIKYNVTFLYTFYKNISLSLRQKPKVVWWLSRQIRIKSRGHWMKVSRATGDTRFLCPRCFNMILGSHNSWSYLPVRKWWMRPIAFMARCQSRTAHIRIVTTNGLEKYIRTTNKRL